MKKVKNKSLVDLISLGEIIVASHKSLSIKSIFAHLPDAVLVTTMMSSKAKAKFFFHQNGEICYSIFDISLIPGAIAEASKIHNKIVVYNWDSYSDVFGFHANISKYFSNGYSGQNKYLDRRKMADVGIPIPETLDIHFSSSNIIDSEGAFIVRPLHHSRGENFEIVDGLTLHRTINTRTHYASALINKKRELRIHCGGGKVFSVVEKFAPANGDVRWNRSTEDSMPFAYINWNAFDKTIMTAMKMALKATETLNMYHSAVDVIIDEHDSVYVLEVNKSVGLDENGFMVQKYVMFFNILFNYPLLLKSWFPYREMKRAKSLVWKKANIDACKALYESSLLIGTSNKVKLASF